MEERLNAISIDKPSGAEGGTKHQPKADTLATLLSQGLQSNDAKIINVSVTLIWGLGNWRVCVCLKNL